MMQYHGVYLGGIFLLLSLTTIGWRSCFVYRKLITAGIAAILVCSLILVRSTEMAKIVIEADLMYDGFIWTAWALTRPWHKIR